MDTGRKAGKKTGPKDELGDLRLVTLLWLLENHGVTSLGSLFWVYRRLR